MFAAAASAKSPQSCLTLCDLIEGSPPGSAIPGIFQARVLEWVAIAFSSSCLACTKVTSHYVSDHFMYICLLRCEGEFYSPCLPKLPDTEWTPNACLFNERMKTEKTVRNLQRTVSGGEQITGHTD